MSEVTLPNQFPPEDASDRDFGIPHIPSYSSVKPIIKETLDIQHDGPPPPPDGGHQAWLQVLGSWSLFFNTWGIINTFGVYQTYYESGALFEASSSTISWIGSIQTLGLLATGAFVGPLYDSGRFRWLLIVGATCLVFGHMMLSLAKTYWQVLLTQGLLLGIGAGCLFVPAVAIIPTYFSSRLGLALGIASSGSSLGGIIYPIMFYHLTNQVGFGWSVRILGFTVLVLLAIPLAVMKMRVKPGKVRSLIDWTAFTDGPYMTFVFGLFFGLTSCYTAFFYVSYFGQASGITDNSLSFYLIPILNAASFFGRIIPSWLSDKIGLMNVMTPNALIMGVTLFCNLVATSVGGLVVTTLLLGFFSASFVSLPGACFVMLTEDKSKIGTRIGMGLAIAGLGVLIAGPGGGAILGADKSNPHFDGLWIFAGTVSTCAGVVFAVLRIWRSGVGLKVKA